MTAALFPGQARGAALIVVLWLVVLLAALVGAFVLTARVEHLQGRVLSEGVVAQEAARAGLEYAMERLDDPDPGQRWRSDGRDYDWRFGSAKVQVRVIDESGKIDLNLADAALLTGLLQAAGVPQQQAAALAGAMLDWRDSDDLAQPGGGAEDRDYAAAGLAYGAKDTAFESVAEVEQVLGMTPALYARLASSLSVNGAGLPQREFAPPLVLAAMGLDPQQVLAERMARPPDGLIVGSGTYSIESRATLGSGRSAVLRAVVRAGGQGVAGSTASAYTILQWQEGAAAP
ncbi:MAG: type II secretion system protein GspK [Pseudoxanthomonas sp.]